MQDTHSHDDRDTHTASKEAVKVSPRGPVHGIAGAKSLFEKSGVASTLRRSSEATVKSATSKPPPNLSAQV